MKTIRYSTPAGGMLAALSVLIIAGSLSAEEAGFVQLGNSSAEINNPATDSADAVIRGQSDLRRRNARTAQALRQFFQTEKIQRTGHSNPSAPANIQPAGMITTTAAASCDCCPVVDDCCCPVPGCAAPEACCPPGCAAPEACCPPGCAAPSACCDGCCDGRRVKACPQCNGRGCRTCLGSGAYGYGKYGHWNGRSTGKCSTCRLRQGFGSKLHSSAANHRARNQLNSARLHAYLRCKFGYFLHDGSGGVGSPLFGHYKVVYPVDPGYFDDRDGQVYAAQGYGGPVSVPLAPTVRHAYNYGWGIPSSRLTPVSNQTMP